MRQRFGVEAWPVRLAVLLLLIVVPFFRFLLQNEYSLFRAEVVAALAILSFVSLLLAWFSGREAAFRLLTAGVIVLTAALPTQKLLAPVIDLRLAWTICLITVLVLLVMHLMRRNFYPVLAVFVLSSLAVDVAIRFLPDRALRPIGDGSAASGPAHVLYLVLDEHMGPGGFPREMEATRRAAASIEEVYSRHNFRLYPNAFSNYTMTLDSIPSILNRKLVPRSRYFFSDGQSERSWGVYCLKENRLFSDYAARGYRIHVYQHRSIDFASCGVRVDRKEEYWDSLEPLSRDKGEWDEKFQWLVGNYQRSDRVLNLAAAFFPFRFKSHTLGPLSLGSAWDADVLRDILEAKRSTLFFAHLITPHRPYVYERRGGIRDFSSWCDDDTEPAADTEAYAGKYRRYAEQVEFLTTQLDSLFRELRSRNAFDRMLIVVLSDHGSRIRLLGGAAPPPSDRMTFDVYDYAGVPDPQDLLNRFSALLAIKPPGALQPETVAERGSVLRFLQESLHAGSEEHTAGIDSVYLFDSADQPIEIPLPQILETRGER